MWSTFRGISPLHLTRKSQLRLWPGRVLTGRSALVIAHRLSTVRRADQILVMHRGELRERGTHDELLAAGGIYARLHTLQFSDGADACAPRDLAGNGR